MEDTAKFKLDDAQSYDAAAEPFDRFTEKFSTYAVDELLHRSGANAASTIVDIGCGTGVVSIAAANLPAREGAEVIGLDLSEGMLEFARRKAARAPRNRKLTFVRGDAEAMELKDASADAVVSLYALLHLPHPERGVAEIHRILKSGGRVAIAVGSSPSLFSIEGMRAGVARVSRTIAQARGLERGACEHIDSLARAHLPPVPGEDGPKFSASHHDFAGSLKGLLSTAGFRDVGTTWRGREYTIESIEDFWELQTTFSSFARKRMLTASAEDIDKLKSIFVDDCRAVLERGGNLIYRVGASIVSGRKV